MKDYNSKIEVQQEKEDLKSAEVALEAAEAPSQNEAAARFYTAQIQVVHAQQKRTLKEVLDAAEEILANKAERDSASLDEVQNPEAAKIVNLHFPLIYIFARIYIPNLRKLKGKCKFYIFPKNVFFRRKIEDFCKNENFHFFLHTKNYYFFSISLVSSLDF